MLWCLAEHRLSPSIELLRERLGPRSHVSFFDEYLAEPGVCLVDINRALNSRGNVLEPVGAAAAPSGVTGRDTTEDS